MGNKENNIHKETFQLNLNELWKMRIVISNMLKI